MDKSEQILIERAQEGNYRVHRCPELGGSEIHSLYGLRIIARRRAQILRPLDIPEKFRYYEFYSLSHFLDGEAVFQLEGGERVFYKTGQGIIMPPGVKHYYGPETSSFTEDAICFTGIVADLLLRSGVISPRIINIGKERRLLKIMDISTDPSNNSQILANFALQRLITDLYFENLPAGNESHAEAISSIIRMIQGEPEKWWTVPELAELCGLGDDQFRTVFKKQTGWSPKLFIDRIKINRAAEQIAGSNQTVAETARRLGYSDPYHFSRRFKQLIGIAPENYRREHSWP